MPNWIKAGVRALSLAVAFASSGCNATCIRDSDCLGQSVCSENRCILIVGRDAGTRSPPSDDTSDDTSDGGRGGAGGSDGLPSTADAGN